MNQAGLVLVLACTLGLAVAGPIGGSAPGRMTHDGSVPGGYPSVDGGFSAGAIGDTNTQRLLGPVAGLGRTALAFDGKDDFALVRSFGGLPKKTMTAAAWICIKQGGQQQLPCSRCTLLYWSALGCTALLCNVRCVLHCIVQCIVHCTAALCTAQ
jgi:hypothetical protein